MEAVFKALSDYGVPWVMVGVLGWVCWQLFKELRQSQKARLEDSKELLEHYAETRRTLEMMTSAIQALIHGRSR